MLERSESVLCWACRSARRLPGLNGRDHNQPIMSSYCTFLLLLAAAAPGLAAPILDILADPCTGTAHPKASPPMCYSGGMSILGGTWTESVVLHVKEFDAATGKGFVAFDAEGASPQHCNKTPFTKATDSQDITVDFGHCISGATVDAKYCSDQVCVLPTAHCRQLFARVTHRSLSSLFTPFPSRIRTRS